MADGEDQDEFELEDYGLGGLSGWTKSAANASADGKLSKDAEALTDALIGLAVEVSKLRDTLGETLGKNHDHGIAATQRLIDALNRLSGRM